MYFPYFRGRQYEMLALKELANGGLLGNSIIPVVEPIKLTSTFNLTIQSFTNARSRIAIIFNPNVGDFAGTDNFTDLYCEQIGGMKDIEPTLLMNRNMECALESLVANGISQSSIIAVLDKRDSLDIYKAKFTDLPPQFTLFPDERQIKRTVKQGRVLFDDKFNKQVKNADYDIAPDEFFSDDHLYYESEGYSGFGDYSVIGNTFDESGFAPYAVAIHIVYFDNEGILRIHHFVSDSNFGIEDVAGKYYEAVTKLVDWFDSGHVSQKTNALSTFLSHYENGYYPGLPTIKKLSIMHHLELMGKYLDGIIA